MAAYSGDWRWLRFLWLPAFTKALTLASSAVVIASLGRISPHFKARARRHLDADSNRGVTSWHDGFSHRSGPPGESADSWARKPAFTSPSSSFVAFLFWVIYPQDQWDWLTLLMLLTGFFVSIVLHELGHTLAARRCGVTVTRLVLWPLGGLRELSRDPEKPRQRFLIHSAGPLASLLCVLLWRAATSPMRPRYRSGRMSIPSGPDCSTTRFSIWRSLNGLLVIATLPPVNPLDGGGMLEALLGRRSGKGPAETVSKVLAVTVVPGLVILGIVAGDSVLLEVCLMLALGIAAFNPSWRRWILTGINVLVRHRSPARQPGAPLRSSTIKRPRRSRLPRNLSTCRGPSSHALACWRSSSW